MISLKDLVPERASFKMKCTGNKEHFFRPVSIEDWQWLNKKFKQDEIKQIFKQTKLPKIAQFLYKLLEDRTDFPAEDIEDNLDEDGEKVEAHRRPGFQVFLSSVAGMPEEVIILTAFAKALGASKAVIAKFSKKDQEEFDKKKDH